MHEYLDLLQFELIDPYTLTDKQEVIAIGDYYWMNDIEIIDVDFSAIVEDISSANNFMVNDTIIYHPPLRIDQSTVNQVNNYRTKETYIREYIEVYGEGYAPLYLIGRVDTITGRLTVERLMNKQWTQKNYTRPTLRPTSIRIRARRGRPRWAKNVQSRDLVYKSK